MLSRCDGYKSRLTWGAPQSLLPMLVHAAIVCLIVLSISILIAHAIDALRT
jgi:hypothetical protein